MAALTSSCVVDRTDALRVARTGDGAHLATRAAGEGEARASSARGQLRLASHRRHAWILPAPRWGVVRDTQTLSVARRRAATEAGSRERLGGAPGKEPARGRRRDGRGHQSVSQAFRKLQTSQQVDRGGLDRRGSPSRGRYRGPRVPSFPGRTARAEEPPRTCLPPFITRYRVASRGHALTWRGPACCPGLGPGSEGRERDRCAHADRQRQVRDTVHLATPLAAPAAQ